MDRKHILIIGGGPDASKIIEAITYFTNFPYFDRNKLLLIAIDGATELLAKFDIIPHLVFTDLDGLQLDTVSKSKYKDTCFIVHAHGDNMDKLDEFHRFILSRKVVGTTQSNSKLPIINSGGFTDGDRALFFLQSFLHKSHTLLLVGYDFNSIIGAFSKPNLTMDTPASELKQKKLKYGAELTRDFCKKTESGVIFIEGSTKNTLKSELSELKNCTFCDFQDEDDVKTIFPNNLLFLKH